MRPIESRDPAGICADSSSAGRLSAIPFQVVILSGAGTSRSEVSAESKDPYIFRSGKDASGSSPRATEVFTVSHLILAAGNALPS